MNRFTLMQKFRNKIRIDSDLDLFIANNAKIVDCDIRVMGKNIQLTIEEGSVLRHTQIEILGDNSAIVIGKNCIVGHGCYFSAKEGKRVTIKDDCMLSRNVKIMTSDGHHIFQEGKLIKHAKDITFEEHVWLADNVTILKVVRVGNNSVVGINSTVTKDVPHSSIIAGNPAKVVKDEIVWEE